MWALNHPVLPSCATVRCCPALPALQPFAAASEPQPASAFAFAAATQVRAAVLYCAVLCECRPPTNGGRS